MNLERHLRVLWRYKIVVAVGLILGLALALLGSYKVGSGGLERRGTQVWSSSSQILVTQKGFPWGRVTLPASVEPNNPADPAVAQNDGSSPDRIQYADPGRFVNLALLYSVISHSDQVRDKLPQKPTADQIQAIPLDPTNSGQSFLPIITLTTTAKSPSDAVKLNKDVYTGLRELLIKEQEANHIPAANRVLLSVLSKPQQPALMQGYSMTSSLLAFMLALIATISFVHILEALRLAKLRRNAPEAGALAHPHPVAAHANGHQPSPAPAAPPLAPVGSGAAPPPPPPSTWR